MVIETMLQFPTIITVIEYYPYNPETISQIWLLNLIIVYRFTIIC